MMPRFCVANGEHVLFADGTRHTVRQAVSYRETVIKWANEARRKGEVEALLFNSALASELGAAIWVASEFAKGARK